MKGLSGNDMSSCNKEIMEQSQFSLANKTTGNKLMIQQKIMGTKVTKNKCLLHSKINNFKYCLFYKYGFSIMTKPIAVHTTTFR